MTQSAIKFLAKNRDHNLKLLRLRRLMQVMHSCAMLPSHLHLNHQRKHFTVWIYGCRIILAICCMMGKRLPCETCLNINHFEFNISSSAKSKDAFFLEPCFAWKVLFFKILACMNYQTLSVNAVKWFPFQSCYDCISCNNI